MLSWLENLSNTIPEANGVGLTWVRARSDPLGLVSPNLCPKTCSWLRVIGLPQAQKILLLFKYFMADPPRNKSELQDLRSTLRLGIRLSMSNFSILVIYNSLTVILAVSIGALIFLTLSVLDSSFPRATLFNLTSAWNCECWNLGSFWLVACELPMLLTKLRRKVDVALD